MRSLLRLRLGNREFSVGDWDDRSELAAVDPQRLGNLGDRPTLCCNSTDLHAHDDGTVHLNGELATTIDRRDFGLGIEAGTGWDVTIDVTLELNQA